MSDEVFAKLADALDELPNGFPRTPSGVEIPLLKKIFSEEEASLASQLSGDEQTLEAIAKAAKLSVQETREMLSKMAERGLVDSRRTEDGEERFRLEPFIVGIYEAQLGSMDHELAHLVEEYMADGGAAGIMRPQPALHRVVPAHGSVKSEWIVPYDDARALLLAAKTFRLRDCICRVQQDQIGRRCEFPVRSCLSFSSVKRPTGPNDITQQEALAFLDKTEEIGLVHTVSNVVKGVNYVCNCCGCCCGILRGINDWGIENSVAHANYFAVIDPDECLGCETCKERCQVHAISMADGIATVDRERCIGCGLCVTGCPSEVARLERKPEAEVIQPPIDYASWERERLRNRGLAK